MAEPVVKIIVGQSDSYHSAIKELLDIGVYTPEMVLDELMAWTGENDLRSFVKGSLLFRDDDNECIIR